MYCPKCLSNSLHVESKGVIEVYINGKKRDNGRFLYNTETSSEDEISLDFYKKVEEFLSWYADFKNKDPIEIVELSTTDVHCDRGCRFSPVDRFSAIDSILGREIVREIVEEVAAKHNLEIELNL